MALIDKTYFFGDLEVAQKSDPAVSAGLQWFIDEFEPELLTDLLGYELYRDFQAGLQQDPIPQKWLDLLYGKEYTNTQGKLTKWNGLLHVTSTVTPGTYIPGDIEIIISGDLIGATSYSHPTGFLNGKSFRVCQDGIGNLGSRVTIDSNGFTLAEGGGGVFAEGARYYIEFTAPVPLPTPAEATAGTAKKSLIANYVFYQYSRQQTTATTGTGEKQLSAQNAINAIATSKQVQAWNKMVEWNCELYDFLTVYETTYPQFEADYCKEIFEYKNSLGL